MNPLIAPDAERPLTALSVNVNKVAQLRNARHLDIPSVLHMATLCLQAGADGITVHPRPDERHVRAADVHALSALLRDWPQAEYNVEGNPLQNLMGFIRAVRPNQATFVPDGEDQFTSDHGWDLAADGERLRPLIAECHALGVRVSLFMDPTPEAMALVRAVGADRVELYTEPYAAAHAAVFQATAAHAAVFQATAAHAAVFAATAAHAAASAASAAVQPDRLGEQLKRFAAAAAAAQAEGLGVNAGHDLNRHNLPDFLRAVPGVLEVSIGHALVADALEFGMAETVRAYLRNIRAGARSGQSARP